MEINFLTIMAYLIVVITVITMVFGIIAYSVYKMREAKRTKTKNATQKDKLSETKQQEKYLFFEQKELIV